VTRKNQTESVNKPDETREESIRPKLNWLKLDNPPISVYANQMELQITNWDFRFRFGEVSDQQEGITNVTEKARVVMSPQHTKAFLNILTENVRKYESKFGEIRITPSESPEKTPRTQ
jgi:hypothetical protein